MTNSVACSRAVTQLTNLVVNSSTQAQVYSFPTYHPSLSPSSSTCTKSPISFQSSTMSSTLIITTTTPTSTLSNSGDRHVPTLQALVKREPRSLGEQHYFVPPSWKVFKETQGFSWTLKKCSFLVRWRLCWAISRQQFNITSPTLGRIGAKTKCTVLPIVKNLFHKTRCFTNS